MCFVKFNILCFKFRSKVATNVRFPGDIFICKRKISGKYFSASTPKYCFSFLYKDKRSFRIAFLKRYSNRCNEVKKLHRRAIHFILRFNIFIREQKRYSILNCSNRHECQLYAYLLK